MNRVGIKTPKDAVYGYQRKETITLDCTEDNVSDRPYPKVIDRKRIKGQKCEGDTLNRVLISFCCKKRQVTID
jgi:hypothetical protein